MKTPDNKISMSLDIINIFSSQNASTTKQIYQGQERKDSMIRIKLDFNILSGTMSNNEGWIIISIS